MADRTTAGPMLARFGLGALLFAGEELARKADEWRVLDAEPRPGRAPQHVLLGLLVVAPGALRRRTQRLRSRVTMRARALGTRLPPFLEHPFERLRRNLQERARMLADLGAHEEARARRTFAAALTSATKGFIGELAEATSLRDLVLQQSSSVQEEMLDRLRTRLADADTRLESWLHRGHRPREPST